MDQRVFTHQLRSEITGSKKSVYPICSVGNQLEQLAYIFEGLPHVITHQHIKHFQQTRFDKPK